MTKFEGIMKRDFVKELTWRGLIHDMMPGTEDQLKNEMTTGYIGFDPTADSLHIGSLIPIIILMHFHLLLFFVLHIYLRPNNLPIL